MTFERNQKVQIKIMIPIFFREKASRETSPLRKNTGNKISVTTQPRNINQKSQRVAFSHIDFFRNIVEKPERKVDSIPQIIEYKLKVFLVFLYKYLY